MTRALLGEKEGKKERKEQKGRKRNETSSKERNHPHPRNKFLVAAKIAVKSQFVAAKDDVTGICRNSTAIRP